MATSRLISDSSILFALCDTVTHCWHTASNLGRSAHFTRGCLDDLGIGLERLMGRQHVIGGDDADMFQFGTGAQNIILVPQRQRQRVAYDT